MYSVSRWKEKHTWLHTHPAKTSITAAFPSAWVKAAGIGTVTFRDWLMWYCICSQVCVWYQSAACRPSVKVGESRSPIGLCLTDRVSLSIPWPLRSRQDLKSQPCQLCDWTNTHTLSSSSVLQHRGNSSGSVAILEQWCRHLPKNYTLNKWV